MSFSTTPLVKIDDQRHLLRRLTFAATPDLQQTIGGKRVDAAVDALVSAARRAPAPMPPEFVRAPWTNTALRVPGMTSTDFQARRKAQSQANQRDLELLRLWWLREMTAGPAPLRENLALFLHGTIGSSTGSADMPQAVHGANALLRRSALGTIPDLLEALVGDPAMMVQIGIDELRRDRDPEGNVLSHRAARAILTNWTVGAGQYTEADAVNLSSALTGWLLVAPPGQEPPVAADPTAFRSARRTGLTPVFVREEFDNAPKTILGRTDNFDSRGAVRFLARHPATARRYSARLVRYFGVDDPGGRLEARLVATYQATDGSIEALVREIAYADQFWSAESRWNLIKSPVQLLVGVCRQLGIDAPPAQAIAWLASAGQQLFDTPSSGNDGWVGQDAWVTPQERLAVRYRLGTVLMGRPGVPRSEAKSVSAESVRSLVTKLDVAPGLSDAEIDGHVGMLTSDERSAEAVRRIVSTRQYQLA